MTTAEAPAFTLNIAYMIGSVACGTAFLTWFIADQFSRNRRLIYRIISRHNREDDERFAALSDEIWQVRLRNAARDGDEPPPRKTFPQRRYLQETDDESGDALGQPAS